MVLMNFSRNSFQVTNIIRTFLSPRWPLAWSMPLPLIVTVACMHDICMYSCADTKEHREEQLLMLLDGETVGLKHNCVANSESLNVRRPTSIVNSTQAQLREDVKNTRKTNLGPLFTLALSPMGVMSVRHESEPVEGAHRALDSQAQEADVILSSITDTTTNQSIRKFQ